MSCAYIFNQKKQDVQKTSNYLFPSCQIPQDWGRAGRTAGLGHRSVSAWDAPRTRGARGRPSRVTRDAAVAALLLRVWAWGPGAAVRAEAPGWAQALQPASSASSGPAPCGHCPGGCGSGHSGSLPCEPGRRLPLPSATFKAPSFGSRRLRSAPGSGLHERQTAQLSPSMVGFCPRESLGRRS